MTRRADRIRARRNGLVVWTAVLMATMSHSEVLASSWSSSPDPPPRSWRATGDEPPRAVGAAQDGDTELPQPSRQQQEGGAHAGFADRPAPTPPGRDRPRDPYNPIHYQFRAANQEKRPPPMDLPTDVPLTELDRVAMESRSKRGNDHDDDDHYRPYASPRTDVVTVFMSNKRGRVLLTLSSGAVGMALGSFLGKSLVNNATPFALAFASLFVTCTFLRNPYGELSRALGMALILALQRTRSIRKRYPAWPHVKACLAAGPRMPTDPVDYPMLQSVMAMALVGVACGANLPLLPSWMGAMAGGASLAMWTTLPTANGDLARSMGMRVVSLVEEVWVINSELQMMSKIGVVSGKVLDRILILDRKHRIKDKLVAVFSWGYDQVTRTAQKVQSEMGQEGDAEEQSRTGRRREDGRKNDRDGDGGRRYSRDERGDNQGRDGERGGSRTSEGEREWGGDQRSDYRR